MAKAKPPPSNDSPSRSSRRSLTAELTARALRAAGQLPGDQRPSAEVITEILDQDQLPLDLDEETLPVHDPRLRLKEQTEPKEAGQTPAPQDEDARKAEVLLKSFLAAHVRTRGAPDQERPKEEEKKAPRAAPKPAGRSPAGSAPRVRRTRTASRIPPSAPGRGGALRALDHAQPPGVLVIEHTRPGDGLSEEENPELAAAVDDAIGLLFGVRGIHHIGPGQDEAGEPVVVVAAGRDFGEAALKQIPETVGNFRTIVTIPFDLLPLRRSR